LAIAVLCVTAAGCTTIEPKGRARAGAATPPVPPVGVVTFASQRNDVAGWKAVDAALETRAGHVRSRVFLAVDDSVQFPLVHITTWDNATALATALVDESVAWSAVAPKGSSGIYGLSSAVGNIRDSLMSSVMIVVPFDTPADSAGAVNGFRLVDEFFRPQAGFVGSVLLRRIGGDGGFGHVILSRWASRGDADAVMHGEVFRTLGGASGIDAKLAFYVSEEE